MESFYPVIIALVFNLIDMVSGIIYAVYKKTLKSDKMRDGLFKKAGFIFCYFLAWILDNYGNYIGFSLGVKILPAIILYVVSTELVSIFENLGKINPKLVPDKMKELFHLNFETEEKE